MFCFTAGSASLIIKTCNTFYMQFIGTEACLIKQFNNTIDSCTKQINLIPCVRCFFLICRFSKIRTVEIWRSTYSEYLFLPGTHNASRFQLQVPTPVSLKPTDGHVCADRRWSAPPTRVHPHKPHPPTWETPTGCCRVHVSPLATHGHLSSAKTDRSTKDKDKCFFIIISFFPVNPIIWNKKHAG